MDPRIFSNPHGVNLDPNALYARDDSAELRKAFAWLTRTGAGRRFGSLPIGWYQQHQIKALDLLRSAALNAGFAPKLFRLHRGEYQAYNEATRRWVPLGLTPHSLFEKADHAVRGW